MMILNLIIIEHPNRTCCVSTCLLGTWLLHKYCFLFEFLYENRGFYSAGAPQALLQSCITFGAFSFILEGLNKQQPALAHPVFSRKRIDMERNRPPLVLPLQFALPVELKGAFSAFCKSLEKSKKSW